MRLKPFIRSVTAGALLFGGAAAVASPSKVADGTLNKRIEERIKSDARLREEKIDVAVSNGVAKLSGRVSTRADKARAAKLAQIKGIKAVDNRLDIEGAPKASSDGVGGVVEDSWITTKVKAELTNQALLKGSDISVETNNGVVKLTGTVTGDAARERATELVRSTKGVRRIDDQMILAPKH